MKKSSNGRLEESTALLQQAMATVVQNQATLAHAQATLVQNQALFITTVQELKDRMDRLEAIVLQKFAELPEKVFGFAQAAKKESG